MNLLTFAKSLGYAAQWLTDHQRDIDDAFVVLNPDMFDVTEVGEA